MPPAPRCYWLRSVACSAVLLAAQCPLLRGASHCAARYGAGMAPRTLASVLVLAAAAAAQRGPVPLDEPAVQRALGALLAALVGCIIRKEWTP